MRLGEGLKRLGGLLCALVLCVSLTGCSGCGQAEASALRELGRVKRSGLPACTALRVGKSFKVDDCRDTACTAGGGTVTCEMMCVTSGAAYRPVECISAAGAINVNPTTTSSSSSSSTSTSSTTSTTA